MNNEQCPPEWVNELIEDHYERVAEDPKPRLSLADTIWDAYMYGRDEARAERGALGAALRRVVGRAREWGDFNGTDFGDALREAGEALATLEDDDAS